MIELNTAKVNYRTVLFKVKSIFFHSFTTAKNLNRNVLCSQNYEKKKNYEHEKKMNSFSHFFFFFLFIIYLFFFFVSIPPFIFLADAAGQWQDEVPDWIGDNGILRIINSSHIYRSLHLWSKHTFFFFFFFVVFVDVLGMGWKGIQSVSKWVIFTTLSLSHSYYIISPHLFLSYSCILLIISLVVHHLFISSFSPSLQFLGFWYGCDWRRRGHDEQGAGTASSFRQLGERVIISSSIPSQYLMYRFCSSWIRYQLNHFFFFFSLLIFILPQGWQWRSRAGQNEWECEQGKRFRKRHGK